MTAGEIALFLVALVVIYGASKWLAPAFRNDDKPNDYSGAKWKEGKRDVVGHTAVKVCKGGRTAEAGPHGKVRLR